MTPQEALRRIQATLRQMIYASRRGIVAATYGQAEKCYAFRRVDGRVRFEEWFSRAGATSKVMVYELAPAIECEAATMLDSL